jgi:AraC-like DNA-binding protein
LTDMNDATELAGEVSSADPAVGLRAVASLRALLESLERLQVENARTQGWSWQQIADALGVSKNYLTQIFHHELGISPWEFLSRYRIKQAKEMLCATDTSITAVAAQVGFDDASYFGRVFRKQVGCSPQAFRDRMV